jgi:hypothetical protein
VENYKVKLGQPHTVWQPVVPYTVPTLGVKVSVTNTPQREPELMDVAEARAVLARIMAL